ncbi:conserved hypothetical protein [Beutenbergia cavernae DSM 12333]|uniref:SURF1-like protein n=2 Tax=Beutenbergia TaxID=84756 RepID=C5BZW0_BEUC1|nr:conserved hypothetical protein [Beutenbergia cavernae DSM 12333]
MLALLALFLVAALVCGRLGAWQLDRARQSAEMAQEIADAAEANAAPVPLDDVTRPGEPVLATMIGVRVDVTGTFDAAEQLFVPGVERDGRSGYLVLAPLVVESSDALVTVVRGWVASPEDAGQLPEGEVSIVGQLGSGEAYEPGERGDGEVLSVSPAQLANTWGVPMYGMYVVAQETSPAPAAAVLVGPPPPPAEGGGGLNWRNIAYAAEWWVFGGFAVLLWVRLVRDEVRHRREDDGAALA